MKSKTLHEITLLLEEIFSKNWNCSTLKYNEDMNFRLGIQTKVQLVQPNEPDQPDLNLTRILTLRANATRLNPSLDPGLGAQPNQKTGGIQIGFIKYIIGLNPILNPI